MPRSRCDGRRAATHTPHDLVEAFIHVFERCHQLACLIATRCVDAPREIALRHAFGHFDSARERTRDAACDRPRGDDACDGRRSAKGGEQPFGEDDVGARGGTGFVDDLLLKRDQFDGLGLHGVECGQGGLLCDAQRGVALVDAQRRDHAAACFQKGIVVLP